MTKESYFEAPHFCTQNITSSLENLYLLQAIIVEMLLKNVAFIKFQRNASKSFMSFPPKPGILLFLVLKWISEWFLSFEILEFTKHASLKKKKKKKEAVYIQQGRNLDFFSLAFSSWNYLNNPVQAEAVMNFPEVY